MSIIYSDKNKYILESTVLRPSSFLIHNGFARDPERDRAIQNYPGDKANISCKNIKIVIDNLYKNFSICWEKVKANSSKLSFYHQCKTKFKNESYLSDVKNFNDRAALTRIRISAHDLKIETGRYSNQALEERNCIWCHITMNKNIVENEQHFLLECDLYNAPRRSFMPNVCENINTSNSICQPFSPLTLESFLTIDNNSTHNRKLSKAIASMFKIRDEFIESTVTPINN